MIYVYGIDLAQSLNYTGIIVTKVSDKKIKIVAIRKYKDMTYPELEKILFDDLFRKFSPKCVVVDYTNERSFAETIESRLNSSFMNPNSSDYRRWKTVQPVTFSQEVKLELKQTAREMMEKRQFALPRFVTDSRVRSLVSELKEQMLREAGSLGANGRLRFPKTEGHDNDLVIALELNLYGAKKFLYHDPEDWGIRRTSRYNPWEKYTCNLCRQDNHQGQPHYIYYDLTGGEIGCTCKICNGL